MMLGSNTRPATSTSESQPMTNDTVYYGAVRVDDKESETSGLIDSWAKEQHAEVADDDDSRPIYRDVIFSVLFILHLGAMLYLGIAYGSWTIHDVGDNGKEDKEDQNNVMVNGAYLTHVALYLAAPCSAVSFFLTFVATSFLIPTCATLAVASSLVLSIASTITFAMTLCFYYPGGYTLVWSFMIVAISAYYVMLVWNLIPFAATNLVVSIKGMNSNWGMYFIAIIFSALSFLWWFAWFFVANGLLNSKTSDLLVNSCEEDDPDCAAQQSEEEGILWGTLFLLLISLYWTCTVLLNTIQVTVAGVMGTWCFDKTNASTCCSSAVTSSLWRSMTYSFGSICLGSLLEAIVTALRLLASIARDRDDNSSRECGILVCIIQCILSMIEDIIEYFNRWAYVFVGIYGYSYVESGKKVIELFRARGWTSIIAYDLVGYVLNFTAFAVGLCTGFFGVALATTENLFRDLEGRNYWGFGIGFILGVFIASIMTNVIKGAVNTLIVCFADAPVRLEENHPQMTQKMAKAWVSVFPNCGIMLQKEQNTGLVV